MQSFICDRDTHIHSQDLVCRPRIRTWRPSRVAALHSAPVRHGSRPPMASTKLPSMVRGRWAAAGAAVVKQSRTTKKAAQASQSVSADDILSMSPEELTPVAHASLSAFAKALKERGASLPDDALKPLADRAALAGNDEEALTIAVEAASLPSDFRLTALAAVGSALDAAHEAKRIRAETILAARVAAEPCDFARVEEAVEQARAAGVEEGKLEKALYSAAKAGEDAVADLLTKATRQVFDPNPILEAMRAENAVTAAHGAEALCAAATDPTKRADMVEAGCLPEVLQVLSADRRADARQHAAAAVRALSVDKESEDVLVAGGAIARLVECLGGSHAGGRVQAARALEVLATRRASDVASHRVETAPGVPPTDVPKLLVAMLVNGSDSSASSGSSASSAKHSMAERESAAGAIGRLLITLLPTARRAEICAVAVDQGAVPVLVKLLTLDAWADSASKAAVLRGRLVAASTLHALTRSSAARRTMVVAGAIPLLCDFLKDYDQLATESKDRLIRVEEEQKRAEEWATAERRTELAKEERLKEHGSRGQTMIDAADTDDEAADVEASGATRRRRGSEAGKMEKALQDDAQTLKVQAASGHSADGGGSRRLQRAGRVSREATQPKQEATVQRSAAQIEREQAVAARVAAAKAKVEARKAEAEAAQLAAEDAKARREREIREERERMEAERNAEQEAERAMAQRRLEAKLIADSKEQAVATLRNLALDRENNRAIAAAGALELLVPMLQPDDTEDVEALNEGSDAAMRNSDAIDTLHELHCLDQPVSVGRPAQAAGCLSNLLLNNPRNRRTVIAMGAIPRLVSLLAIEEHARSYGPVVRVVAAAALCNLTGDGYRWRRVCVWTQSWLIGPSHPW